MAHYAEDCWDCELHTSYGWVECVGLADRSAFDLCAHTTKSKTELVAHEKFSEPRMEEVLEVKPNRKELGIKFKGAMKAIVEVLSQMPESDLTVMKVRAVLALMCICLSKELHWRDQWTRMVDTACCCPLCCGSCVTCVPF